MVEGHSMILTIFVNPLMFLSMATMLYFNEFFFFFLNRAIAKMYYYIVLHSPNVGKFGWGTWASAKKKIFFKKKREKERRRKVKPLHMTQVSNRN